MLNTLKLTIEFERYENENRSYLIINDEVHDDKCVLTGEEAGKASEELYKMIKQIYLGEKA